jgi:hypothetical protein
MQAFIVSLIAGLLFPLVLPLGTELGAINEIHVDTWAITGTVYAAAMGLVSRNQAIAFAGLFFTAACAVIYGVAKSVGEGHGDIYFLRFGSIISGTVIFTFSVCYIIERYGRHVTDAEPFVEFEP